MRQSLEIKLGQRLTMTPQLQQAIRLLQLSAVELQAEIQEALESNPLLEENDNIENSGAETEAASSDVADRDNADSELDLDRSMAEVDDTAVELDWDSTYDGSSTINNRNGNEPGFEIDARASLPQTLRDHLTWQMHMTLLSEHDQAIAQAIIDAINDDGYLSCSIDDICQSLLPELEAECDEAEAVLHQIQNFDPIGVGARNLSECVLLQLHNLAPDTPGLATAIELAQSHLDLLASRDLNQLRRIMKITAEALQEAVQLIQSLNPRPGGIIHAAHAGYVVPDVVLRKRKGRWVVELNENAYPRIGINRIYADMIQRGKDSVDNRYLQDHLQEARWFIKSLRNRHETLLKVAGAIVDHQRDFFEHGEEAMKPLVLHDIAEQLGMHESTISRVTTQKYMLTPRGILELKYFFSSHVSTSDGGTCSATAIRSMIRKLIDAESSEKPISDSTIVNILENQGIHVARRTIAKYRENMNIPPSSQRKSLI